MIEPQGHIRLVRLRANGGTVKRAGREVIQRVEVVCGGLVIPLGGIADVSTDMAIGSVHSLTLTTLHFEELLIEPEADPEAERG